MPHFFCVLPVSYHGGRQSGSSIWFISIYSKVLPFRHFHEMAVLLFGNSKTPARSPVTAADRRFSVACFSKVCPPALPGRVNKFSLQVSSEAKGKHSLAASPAASGGATVPHQLGSLQNDIVAGGRFADRQQSRAVMAVYLPPHLREQLREAGRSLYSPRPAIHSATWSPESAALLPETCSPSRIVAPGAESDRRSRLRPNPLPPEVQKGTSVLPVQS